MEEERRERGAGLNCTATISSSHINPFSPSFFPPSLSHSHTLLYPVLGDGPWPALPLSLSISCSTAPQGLMTLSAGKKVVFTGK